MKRPDFHLWRTWRGLWLFIRSLQTRPVSDIAPVIGTTPQGHTYEVYQPRGKAWKTVVPVYGMGLFGEHEPRLYKFIQSCLEVDARVSVPNLPGVKSYRLENRDLDILADTLEHIRARFGGDITIVAFSAGASLSLCAAALPRLAGKIHSLLLFSPLYDIREVWNRLHHQEIDHTNHKTLDNALWTQYVIAFRNREKLRFSEAEKATIEDTLRRYDFGITDEEKCEFHARVIAPLQLNQRSDLLMEDEAFDMLSPRGKLSDFRARVAILHDATDTIVPPEQGQRIMEELRQRPGGQQRLLISPLLAHVAVQAGVNLFDVYKIIEMLGEVFV